MNEEVAGKLNIPSVGEGHIEITFDNTDEAETLKAERIVKEMLERGYIIIVETSPGTWERVEAFDKETCCYLLTDDPNEPLPNSRKTKRSGKSKRTKRVSARSNNAVAVARTAGG